MELETYVYDELLDCDHYTDKAKRLLTDVYMHAYHDGRHSEREKLVESKYLIIDPNKKEQLLKDCEDPCKYCENYTKEYKIGCSVNPKECKLKQKQFLAIEIKNYFL